MTGLAMNDRRQDLTRCQRVRPLRIWMGRDSDLARASNSPRYARIPVSGASFQSLPCAQGSPETTGPRIAASAVRCLQHLIDQRTPVPVCVDEELFVVLVVGGADGVVEQPRADLGDPPLTDKQWTSGCRDAPR